MGQFKQFDVVRIVRMRKTVNQSPDGISARLPKVGDIATIVDLYEVPEPGFELECVNTDGKTEWLHGFSATEIVIEKIAV